MNRAFLLGSLFLRVSTVYGGAVNGDLISEGRRRNEEAYERALEITARKEDARHLKAKRALLAGKENPPVSTSKNN